MFTSPHLEESDRILRECPIGAVLREAPHVYDAIRASNAVESGAMNPIDAPIYLQHALSVIISERDRLWRMRDDERKSKSDSSHGMKVRHGNH